jgi:uncharacterized protein YjbI with pentapeptide repeats
VRDVIVAAAVAVLVSAGTIAGQKMIDDVRADRDHQISRDENDRAERLENLRFVRARSTSDSNLERPFYGLDLAGLNLAGLELPGANLGESNLSETNLLQTNLHSANLAYAVLIDAVISGVDFTDADLTGADLTHVTINNELARKPAPGQPVVLTDFAGARLTGIVFDQASLFDVSLAGRDLSGASFRDAALLGVDLTSATLTDADFDGVAYDESTVWPADFTPPPSAE